MHFGVISLELQLVCLAIINVPLNCSKNALHLPAYIPRLGIYSTPVVDKATTDCRCDDRVTGVSIIQKTYPTLDFLVSISLA